MKKKHYLPPREPERVIWLNNFAAKLSIHAATVGISAAEVAIIEAMALIYSYIIGLIELSKTYTEELTQFKNRLSRATQGTPLGTLPELTPAAAPALTQSGIFTYIGRMVKRIKGHDGYTTSIGEALGIIGNEDAFDADSFVPELAGKSMPGFVDLRFVKDQADGVNIYYEEGPEWKFLSRDTESPYHDTRALKALGSPEIRRYRCRAVIKDAEIGQWSNVVAVTFSG